MSMVTEYRKNIVQLAEMYVGTEVPNGDDKFIKFYNELTGAGFSVNGTAWCAIFVTYCARHVGIPTSVIPNFASCTISRDSFWKPNKRWKSRTEYTPRAGDIIYFDWDLSGNCDHVGIVKDVDDNYIYTIEGNTKGGYSVAGVRSKKYARSYKYIAGYGVPNYESIGDTTVVEEDGSNDNDIVAGVKAFQKWLNSYIDAGLIIDGSCGSLTRTAAVRAIQTIMNKEYGKNLEVDGSYGPATKAAVKTIKQGTKGTIVYPAQGLLYGHDFDPNGFDGSFGAGMLSAIKEFQSWAGISVDGSCGPDTWYKQKKKW